MQYADSTEIPSADCPASGKPANRSGMGFQGMGGKPDSDPG